MQKVLLVVSYLALFCSAQVLHHVDALNKGQKTGQIQHKNNNKPADNDVPCDVCVDFFDDSLNDILNIVLNLGLGAGCNDLCGNLTSTWEQGVCMLLCVFVGFDGFVTILQDSDLDPIHICVEMDACPANNCQTDCTDVASVTVSPKSAPLRTTFNCVVNLNVEQDVGAGITAVVIKSKTSKHIEFDQLNTGFTAGNYNITIPIETDWDDWDFPPGVYTVEVYSCAEDCENEHGIIFSQGNTTFTITSSA